MGPACAVVDARADGATLWAGSQKPHFARDGVARALGLPRVSHTERRQSRRLLTIKAPGKCLSFLIVRKLHGKNDCLVVLIVIDKDVVSLLYQKGGDSRIFQAQDRAIDDFTLKGKPRNGSIDKF